MPIEPVSKIDRNEYGMNKPYDLTMQDTTDILTKYPTNLGNDKENIQAILFKFHNPIPGQLEPEHPQLQGNNKYIALPIPEELPFVDSYMYDDSSSVQNYVTWIKNMIQRAGQNIGSVFGGGSPEFGNRLKGQTANSQAAITFSNPVFRSFEFSWNIIARDEFEAGVIHAIVQKFRIAAASSFKDGDSTSPYIKYPDMVSFIVYPGNNKFPFPASYPCFIESVGYSPISSDDQIPFFHDSAPLGWKLSLTLKESMYLDKSEIQSGWGIQGF